MKIAVLGAGAVGCYYGGMLARAGHDVVLIGRPQHVDAVQGHGLRLETRAFDAVIPVRASSDAAAVRDARLVLFCVKSTDTESAGIQIAPLLAPDALVLSLQNGVDNAARLQALLPCAAVPAVVYVAAEMAGPGHVRHHGRGDLVIGPRSGAQELAHLLAAAGIPVQVSGNVAGALWAKLTINCAYNALSAITGLPYGRLVQGEGIDAVLHSVVAECLAVAREEGVQVPGDVPAEVQAIAVSMATQISSTAHDVARGKPSEIDHLNGYVAGRGRALGIPTPVNTALHAIVKLLEASRVAPAPVRA